MNFLYHGMLLCSTCNKVHGMLLILLSSPLMPPPPSLLHLLIPFFYFVVLGLLWDVVACRGVWVNAATFAVSVVCYCIHVLTVVHRLLLLRWLRLKISVAWAQNVSMENDNLINVLGFVPRVFTQVIYNLVRQNMHSVLI
jgi:hypothetical protein